MGNFKSENCYQVSSLGDGIGITILNIQLEKGSKCLIFHIVPKVWSKFIAAINHDKNNEAVDQGKKYYFWELEYETLKNDKKELHFILAETDFLQVPDKLVEHFDAIAVKGVGYSPKIIDSVIGDVAFRRKSPLWSKNYPSDSKEREIFGSLKESSAYVKQFAEPMWRMLESFDIQLEPTKDLREFGPNAAPLFRNSELMKPFIIQSFVQNTLEAIKDIKPIYHSQNEFLKAPRGRIDSRDLVNSACRSREGVLCHFEEIRPSNHVWQAIFCALKEILEDSKNSGGENFSEKASEAYRAIRSRPEFSSDIYIQGGHIVVNKVISDAKNYISSSNENYYVRKSYQLALAILTSEYRLAIGSSLGSGVIVNIKYATSKLWEQLAERIISNVVGVSTKGQSKSRRINIFYSTGKAGRWEPADRGKSPDIVVTKDSKSFYVDAKYKVSDLGVTKASMPDQYQMATYALRTRRNVYLAYPICNDSKPKLICQCIPLGAELLDNSSQNVLEFVRTGQFYIPFPLPEQAQRGEYIPPDSWYMNCEMDIFIEELMKTSLN
ncbi:5-methylcytosine restriction system specificity protein McrC [Rothia sp. P4278]|uniref:5-methylcytosine restriction system specificity protein McrC n=1 Tax=Rothia sp. P4278 TaxID=3402658 RepID=UPI003AEB5A96